MSPLAIAAENPRLAKLRHRIERLQVAAPRELDARLERLGYRGQPEARRTVCVLAYRHLRRLQRMVLDGVPAHELPGRENVLLAGPTGCGKTHLVELLFREILQVPTVVVDVTGFSETGYVGSDVNGILTRLVEAAGGDTLWAGCGVACLDEFDKLAGQSSNTRFAGQETTKDVSGWGVQRSLLGLLSAPSAEYAPDYGFSGRTAPVPLALSGVTFIACGAFSRLRPPSEAARPLGFGADPDEAGASAAAPLEPSALERHGFMPELVGRFTRIVELAPLGFDELRAILDGEAGRYRQELEAEGLALELDEGQLTRLAEAALRDRLGARGLRTALTRVVEDLLYERVG